jgi:pilus assembly protein Flp/PilA
MQKTRAFIGRRLLARHLVKDAAGATAIEYALIAMLIAMTIVGVLPSIAPPINNTFNTVAGKL